MSYSNGSIWLEFDVKLSNYPKRDKPVIVRIDQDVKYSRVVKVLDILQKYSFV